MEFIRYVMSFKICWIFALLGWVMLFYRLTKWIIKKYR
jgi:hypothetical protein